MSDFAARYGPWALVAGGSEGLGAAFARALADRGINLILLARREATLHALEDELRSRRSVEVRPFAVDLGATDVEERVGSIVEGIDIGLLVYNAAASTIGPFLERPLSGALASLDVNCRGTVVLCHLLGNRMVQRGRGGIVLMSSLTAFQGTPFVATYAATKAFKLSLAEALSFELRDKGVDVLGVCAGAIRTPSMLRASSRGAPGMLDPEAVAAHALSRLGRRPATIPGAFNRVMSFVMRRVLPRRTATAIMGSQTRKLT